MKPSYQGHAHHTALLLCELLNIDPVRVCDVQLRLPIMDDPPIVVFELVLTPDEFKRAMRPPVEDVVEDDA